MGVRGLLLISHLTSDHGANTRMSVAMVNFLTIDHGANSGVSWSWSVHYPPPPPNKQHNKPYEVFIMKVINRISNELHTIQQEEIIKVLYESTTY